MNTLKNMSKKTGLLLVCSLVGLQTAWSQGTIKLTDPEIASVAVTANQIDVSYGKIALKRSKNADIRKFAQTMITDHSGVIKQATALAAKLGVVPKTNAVTEQLLQGAKSTRQKLGAAKAADFDKAYIDNEVAYHTAVISAVNKLLIPQTQNGELKGLLEKVAPVLQEHLAHAKMVQSEIDNGSH